MESKPHKALDNRADVAAFNRTSLESKRDMPYEQHPYVVLLLIEPVWNRNFLVAMVLLAPFFLLIEPVWNRNASVCHHHGVGKPRLLIEPVWNRNMFIQ